MAQLVYIKKQGVTPITKEEREREKEIKRLIYEKTLIIKEAKKELRALKGELLMLGNNKEVKNENIKRIRKKK